MNDRIKYPAAMGGVLILAAIATQQQGLPRFFYAFLASIYSHMIRTVSSMPSLLLLIESS